MSGYMICISLYLYELRAILIRLSTFCYPKIYVFDCLFFGLIDRDLDVVPVYSIFGKLDWYLTEFLKYIALSLFRAL